ncbi:MAG: hypothetical protein IPJ11_15310 [Gemmatimonadetes bacterium]|nr:hypothetical protein [Gemmatimonadota bacterium]
MTLHPASSRLWIVATLMACAPLPGGSTSAAATSAPRVGRADTVAVLLRQLTIRQKVGQLVMPWLLADYAATDAPTMVRARMWWTRCRSAASSSRPARRSTWLPS